MREKERERQTENEFKTTPIFSDAYVKAICEEVEGPASVRQDDAKSVAKCPTGHTVSSCIVGTGLF